MWSTVRAGLIGLMCISLTSCGWIGCRKKRKDYGKPLPPGVIALRKLTDPEDYPDFGAGFRNRQGMAEASEIVLTGFRLRTDVKIVRYPHRYMDRRGEAMWNMVMNILSQMCFEAGVCQL